MLTFESRTRSALQQRLWELSSPPRIIEVLSSSWNTSLSLLFNHVGAPFVPSDGRNPPSPEAKWDLWRRKLFGREGAPARLSVPLHNESSELAVPQHSGLCSLAKCCLLQADGSGLRRLACGKIRPREQGKEEREGKQKQEGEI